MKRRVRHALLGVAYAGLAVLVGFGWYCSSRGVQFIQAGRVSYHAHSGVFQLVWWSKNYSSWQAENTPFAFRQKMNWFPPSQRLFVFADTSAWTTPAIPFWWVLIVLAPLAAMHLRWFLRRPPPGCCVTCGYDLTGNITGVCSECGADIAKTRTSNPS